MTEILREEIERIPTAAPRDVALLPGLRYSKSVSRTMLWFPLLFVLLIPAIMLVAMSQSPEGKLALRTTRHEQARIERVDRQDVCRHGARIVYAFATPDGVTWRASDRVCPPSAYTAAQPGDSIPVIYVESDPSASAIADGSEPAGDFFLAVLAIPLFFAFIVGALFWPLMGQRARERKLFRTGQLAKGRVVYVQSRREIPWNTSPYRMLASDVYVRARFDGGAEREVVAPCTNEWLLVQLEPGSEVHVCAVGDRAMLIESYLR